MRGAGLWNNKQYGVALSYLDETTRCKAAPARLQLIDAPGDKCLCAGVALRSFFLGLAMYGYALISDDMGSVNS